MAIKGKIIVRQSNFPVWLWVLILGMVVFVWLGFAPLVNALPEAYQQPVSYAVYAIYIVAFIYLLIYTSLWYHMVLTHHDLYIERHILFFRGEAATLFCSQFTGIVPADRYKGSVKPKNYCPLTKIDGLGKYVITYTEKGEQKAAKIMCDRKFHDQIAELIEVYAKQGTGKKSKKKK